MQIRLNHQKIEPNFGSQIEIKRAFAEKIKRYPKDLAYLKTLAKNAGVAESELYKLNPIIGAEQLEKILKSASSRFFNVNEDFHLNLHMHTTHSDGQMSVNSLLEQSSEYANKVEQNGIIPNFTIAITDHDNFDGAREAVEKILAEPERYQNLGVVLGSELSCEHKNLEQLNRPVPFELVAYSINPYDKKMGNFLKCIRDERIDLSKQIIENAKKLYPQYNFSYEDACEFSPNPKKGINGFLYAIANYFKDRTNFNEDGEKLKDITLKFLPKINEEKSKIAHSIEEIFTYMKDQFGFLGIAHPAKIYLGDGALRNDFIEKCQFEEKNTGKVVIDNFIETLVKIGGDKFRALETNYQGYKGDLAEAADIIEGNKPYKEDFLDCIKWLLNFKHNARIHNLLDAGGLDTHGETPFIKN